MRQEEGCRRGCYTSDSISLLKRCQNLHEKLLLLMQWNHDKKKKNNTLFRPLLQLLEISLKPGCHWYRRQAAVFSCRGWSFSALLMLPGSYLQVRGWGVLSSWHLARGCACWHWETVRRVNGALWEATRWVRADLGDCGAILSRSSVAWCFTFRSRCPCDRSFDAAWIVLWFWWGVLFLTGLPWDKHRFFARKGHTLNWVDKCHLAIISDIYFSFQINRHLAKLQAIEQNTYITIYIFFCYFNLFSFSWRFRPKQRTTEANRTI